MTITVRRSGANAPATVKVRRSGAWVTAPVFVRRAGAWVPASGVTAIFGGALPITPNAKGAQVGDLVMVCSTQGETHGATGAPSGSGWTLLATSRVGVYYKVLASGDLATQIDSAFSNAYVRIYRGATQVTKPIDTALTGSSFTTAGFTPDARHAGLMMILLDYNTVSTPPTLTAPSSNLLASIAPFYYDYTFTSAQTTTLSLYEHISPPSTPYNGTSFSGSIPDGVSKRLLVLELLT